jgi:hypothetical protein
MALTTGAIARTMSDRKLVENCVLQIVDMKPVAGDRFRLMVSDGVHTQVWKGVLWGLFSIACTLFCCNDRRLRCCRQILTRCVKRC